MEVSAFSECFFFYTLYWIISFPIDWMSIFDICCLISVHSFKYQYISFNEFQQVWTALELIILNVKRFALTLMSTRALRWLTWGLGLKSHPKERKKGSKFVRHKKGKAFQIQIRQAQWRRGSELDLWSSACTGAEVRFPLPALILLQSPWVRDLLYIT